MKNHYIILGLIVAIVVFYINKKRLFNMWVDKWNEIRIKNLHPFIRSRVQKLIDTMYTKHGIRIRLTKDGTIRSFSEQDDLWGIGRDEKGKKIGKTVTDAKAGQSYHNYGLAADFAILDNDGNPIYDFKNPVWAKFGKEAEKLGFKWGASFGDYPHIEDNNGVHWSSLIERFNDGDFISGFVNVKNYA